MMKVFLISFLLIISTVSCSNQAKEAVYNMVHERERQQCLQQGNIDCPRTDSYKKYKKDRNEVMQYEDINK